MYDRALIIRNYSSFVFSLYHYVIINFKSQKHAYKAISAVVAGVCCALSVAAAAAWEQHHVSDC
jgi:hypothetical protein